MTEDQETMLQNMGALSYTPKKILAILRLKDPDQFLADFNNPDSKVHELYQAGLAQAEFILDLKLLQMAKEGDIKAMDKLAIKKRQQQAAEAALARRGKK